MNNSEKVNKVNEFITLKHKGMRVNLKAVLQGVVLMSGRSGIIQHSGSLNVIKSDRRNVILSDGKGHTLKLPVTSSRILSFV